MNSGTSICSGTLLPTGRHILTASHCFTDGNGTPNVSNATAVFTLAGVNAGVPVTSVSIHPSWQGGDFIHRGGDITVLTLSSNAPTDATPYDIYRDTDELARTFDKVGFGWEGTGQSGLVPGTAGTKRAGLNRFDAAAEILNGRTINGSVLPSNYIAANTQLLFDFDSGLSGNDAVGQAAGISNLGEGINEVSSAPGDSGGPAFLDGKIAGVTSWGLVNNATDSSPGINSSFGEFAFDARVSTYASWIDAIIDEVGVPAITDITLSGSTWASGVEYAYSTIAAAGNQLRPLYTQDVNTIEIEFSEHALLGQGGDELTLVGNYGQTYGPSDYSFSYNVGTHVGTWTFNNPLPDGKYRIELSSGSITDAGGNALDSEWSQPFGAANSLDNFANDNAAQFPSGNGASNSTGAFEFYFSLLAGDANQDGVVNSSDNFAVDVNGDGFANSTDTSLIASYQGHALPLRPQSGDYRDDDYVDTNDYQLWRMTYGSTTDLRADGNGNGTVDIADYTIWRDALGAFSVWTTASVGPAPAPIVTPGVAPKVTNVVISGSTSTHDPYDFAAEMSEPGWIAGDQLRTVPVGGADTVSIAFSEDVNVQADHLTLYGLTTANRPAIADFAYDIATMTATWRFNELSLGDNYLVSLSDMVTDVEGTRLDGEWINPQYLSTTNSAVSNFPSGDHTTGGDFNFVVRLLPGDANLDGVITYDDLDVLAQNYGITGALFVDADFNGDGVVDDADEVLFSNHWYTNLQGSLTILTILADLDGDQDVDQADINAIFANRNMSSPTQADGDLDGDGDIDVDDLDLAYAQLGLELNWVA